MSTSPTDFASEPPLDHAELLARVRFSLDQPLRLAPESEQARGEAVRDAIALARREFIRVTPRLLPAVHRAVTRASDRLMLTTEPQVFIEAHPHPNASALFDGEQCIITLHSGLIALLTIDELPAVIGHEIAHATYRHGGGDPQDGVESLLYLESRRAQEISADRAGILAVDDPMHALRAEVKVACGLGEPHLAPDLDAFIEQLSTPPEDHDAPWEAQETHPHLSLRFWAQQRFLDSDVYRALTGKQGGTPLESIEREIEERFLGAGSSAAFRATADHIHEALAWLGIMIVAEDGQVTEVERSLLVEFVGRIWADDAATYARRHGLEAVRRRALEMLKPLRFSGSRSRARVESALTEIGDRSGQRERADRLLRMIREGSEE